MSKRVKAARGRTSASVAGKSKEKVRDIFVARPFEGLVDEAQWIALRELIPAASAPLRLVDEYAELVGDRSVTVATVLPMAHPAMVRADGAVLIGLQRHQNSGDPSRDLADALLCALRTPVGQTVRVPAMPGPGPRLQDLLVAEPLRVTLHTGFDFWVDEATAEDPGVKASLERANASIYPTEPLAVLPAAYWCRMSERSHIRWVLSDDEDLALDALARVGAAGGLLLGDGTRFAGMFRTNGRLVPVWDLPVDEPSSAWDGPMGEFAERYQKALAVDAGLTPAERRSRQGLLGRQLALR